MSLSLNFSVGITTDRTKVSLIDNTTYPDRSALRVYVSLAKVDYANVSTVIPVVGDQDDPAADAIWEGAYGVDGHYKWLYTAFPAYSALTSYAKYDAVIDNGVVYRSKINANTGNALDNTTYWEVIEDPTSLALNKGESNESLNIDTLVYNRILTFHSQAGYANRVSEQAVCNDSDTDEILKDLSDFDTLLTAAIIADNRQEITDGELLCRKMESLYLS